MRKLAVLTSHPIQYQTPFFKRMAGKFDLTVYFCWDSGGKNEIFDSEFGRKIKWDIPLFEGYGYKFLNNLSLKPSSDFLGQINFGIVNELLDNKYDAILMFGWNSFSNWLAFLTAFLTKTPVLLRGENPLNQELEKPRWKIRVKKIVLGWLFRHIAAFLYIGEENKKFYEFYGVQDKKLFFAPYAIDNDRFMAASELLRKKKKVLRKNIGIEKDDAVILFVGKLIEKKRPMDLLKAFELLVTSYKLPVTSHLIFVGDGALRTELEKYCKDNNLKNVHFAGFKNQTELPEYYTMADIFVLPSGSGETWGLVVNEAMCFGLPIIVSNKVGCGPDLVRQGQNGFVFPVGNIDKLKEYLLFLSDKNNTDVFGEKSFEIIKGYSFDRDINGLIKVIGSLN